MRIVVESPKKSRDQVSILYVSGDEALSFFKWGSVSETDSEQLPVRYSALDAWVLPSPHDVFDEDLLDRKERRTDLASIGTTRHFPLSKRPIERLHLDENFHVVTT